MLKNTGGYMLKNTIRFVSYNFPTHFTIVPMAVHDIVVRF